MKLIEINNWIGTLGWTLLHSLWQAAIIFAALFAIQKLIRLTASTRYIFGAAALCSIFCLAAGTFIYLQRNTVSDVISVGPFSIGTATSITSLGTVSTNPIAAATNWIDHHLFVMVSLWLSGVVLLSLRLTTAWWGSRNLVRKSEPIIGYWKEQLDRLAAELDIKASIAIAQCGAITTPIVLGFLKPVILLPIGMLSGLSPEQIESILLHELAHIRRHDYLVNILQSVGEIIFFFNPFVWMLSSAIRTERELCCDDIVVKFKNPLEYAKALHQLESERVWSANVGVAATGNKNQLLQRIKRIMETTEKKERSSRRIYPAVFIMLVLASISWLSVEANWNGPDASLLIVKSEAADTLKKDTTLRKISHSKKLYKITSKNSKPTLGTTDEYTIGDQRVATDLKPLDLDIQLDFQPLVELQSVQTEQFNHNFNFSSLDTLRPSYRGMSDKELEAFTNEFTKEFSKEFSEKFSAFYEKNGPEMEKMMKNLQLNMEELQKNLQEQHIELRYSQVDRVRVERYAEDARERSREAGSYREESDRNYGVAERERDKNEQERIKFDDARGQARENLERAERDRTAHDQARANLDEASADEEISASKAEAIEAAMAARLIKDGYLGKQEKIETLEWTEEGLKVNGKMIKEKDQKHYEGFRQQHFRKTNRTLHSE